MHTKNASTMEQFTEILRDDPENACNFIECNYSDMSKEHLAHIVIELISFAEFICGESFKDGMHEVSILLDEYLEKCKEEDAMYEEMKKLNELIISECINRMKERYGEEWEIQDKHVKQQVYNEVLAEIKV